ncbi:MAG TPA: hypothetical protein VKE88_03285 [Candidatus Nanoarchaeia archaeon]|nr:hypothetical protein [Candidatus Nanoarchaeia archaeon]
MKKASLNLSLETVIGLLLAAIIIPGLVIFGASILGIIQNNPDQSTTNSFEGLVMSLNSFIATKAEDINQTTGKELQSGGKIKIIPTKQNEFVLELPYSLGDDFGLLAFDDAELEQTCNPTFSLSETIKKPTACLQLPCICLSKLGKTNDEGNIIKCETIKNVVSIAATPESSEKGNYGELHTKGLGYNLALWSECGGLFGPGTSFGVKNIKVVKLPASEEGKFNLLFDIAPVQR